MVALAASLASLLTWGGCRSPASPSTPPTAAVERFDVEAAKPASIAWTVQRVADPELVHLHVLAPTAPGAFLVPWLEGITLRPCALVVREDDKVVQRSELTYDDEQRLMRVTTGSMHTRLHRTERGQLDEARGFSYRWDNERVASLTEGERWLHRFVYDESGRLMSIATHPVDDADGDPAREQTFVYDETDLLVERRWRDTDGAHVENYYTYDEQQRLARVDTEVSDAAGGRRFLPAQSMTYEGERLVEFGYATITYDARGLVANVALAHGPTTEYAYGC